MFFKFVNNFFKLVSYHFLKSLSNLKQQTGCKRQDQFVLNLTFYFGAGFISPYSTPSHRCDSYARR
jgi:hypothetical protein